jgi:hypothetical protein
MNNRIIVGALLLGGLAVAGLGLGAGIAQADAPIAWSSPKSLPALRFPVPLSHIMFFWKREDKRAQRIAAQAEIDRLKRLTREGPAIEVLPTLNSEALKSEAAGARVQRICNLVMQTSSGVDSSTRWRITRLANRLSPTATPPVSFAPRSIERCGKTDSDALSPQGRRPRTPHATNASHHADISPDRKPTR